MNETFVTIAGIFSILGFFVGLAATKWGRGVMLDIGRSIRVPFLGMRMVRLGIYDFYDSRSSLARKRGSTRIIDYLRNAKKEIGIIAISLNYSVVHQNLHKDLVELIKKNSEIAIEIYLLNPTSPLVSIVAKATDRTDEELRQYIEQSVERINEAIASLDETEKKRFRVNFYDSYVANSILAVDPHESKGRFLVENYLYKVPIHGRYSFECRRPGSPMYSKLLVAYEEFKRDQWKEAA